MSSSKRGRILEKEEQEREVEDHSDSDEEEKEGELSYEQKKKEIEEYIPTDDDDSDDDIEEETATEVKIQKEVRAIRSSSKKCGTIKKIELIDFMCHKNLHVEFGPDINFISGPNGSGKSALVAALQIALGMNASVTRRANKLQELIRNGAPSGAKIRIFLTNEGERAYKPEEFGPVIVVERVINQNGTSQSKLMNATMTKTISTKKKDVEELANEFGLHVDNPCVVLDQESAKMFLKGSAKDKYEFFLNATDLNTLVNEFQLDKQARQIAKKEFVIQSDYEVSIKKKYEEAQREWTSVQGLKDLDEQLKDTENQYAWAKIRDAQNELDVLKGDLQKLEANKLEQERRVREAQEESNNVSSKYAELQQAVDENGEQLQELKNELGSKKAEIKKQKAPLVKLRQEMDQLQGEIDKIKNLIQKYQDKIRISMKNDKTTSNDDLQATEQALERKNEELSQLDTQFNTQMSQSSQGDSEYESISEEINQIDDQIKTLNSILEGDRRTLTLMKKELSETKSQLVSIEQASSSANRFKDYARFYFWMPKVLDSLSKSEASLRFNHPPLFIGQHVNLSAEEFAKPIEHILAPTLASFLVDSMDDERKLRDFITKLNVPKDQISIFVKKFRGERYDVSRGSPSSEWFTYLNALDITNPEVFNQLVDQHKIEQLVLLDNTKTEKFDDQKKKLWMEIKDGNRKRFRLPQNVIAGYDMNACSYSVKGGSTVFEGVPSNKKFSLFGKSNVDISVNRISDLKEKSDDLETKIGVKTNEIRVHEQNFEKFKKERKEKTLELEKSGNKMMEVNKRRETIQQEIAKLRQKCEEIGTSENQIMRTTFREKMEDAQKELKVSEDLHRQFANDYKEIENSVKPLEKEAEEITNRMKAKHEEIKRAAEELDEFSNNYQPHHYKSTEAQNALEEANKKLEKFQNDFSKKAKQLEENEQVLIQANVPRVEVREPTNKLQRKLREIKTSLENEEKRSKKNGETVEVRLLRIEAERDRAKKNYETVKADLAIVKKRSKALKKAMQKRKTRFETFRDWAEENSKALFSELLKQKGHDGKVLFNHTTKEIDLEWYRKGLQEGSSTQGGSDDEDDEGKPSNNAAFTDTRALSGGERSGATLALLLAFGRTVASPFKLMDEFDVFMDAGARHIAISQLLTDSRFTIDGIRKQCIFLTPLPISKIPDGEDIRKQLISPDNNYYGKGGQRLENGTLDGFVEKN